MPDGPTLRGTDGAEATRQIVTAGTARCSCSTTYEHSTATSSERSRRVRRLFAEGRVTTRARPRCRARRAARPCSRPLLRATGALCESVDHAGDRNCRPDRDGSSNPEIARTLSISEATVKRHSPHLRQARCPVTGQARVTAPSHAGSCRRLGCDAHRRIDSYVMTYLDHAADHTMLPEAVAAMTEAMSVPGNASCCDPLGPSGETGGRRGARVPSPTPSVRPSEVIFTSGWHGDVTIRGHKGIYSAAPCGRAAKRSLFVVEHHAVLDAADWLREPRRRRGDLAPSTAQAG